MAVSQTIIREDSPVDTLAGSHNGSTAGNCAVVVEQGCIVVERLVLNDPELASYVGERDLVERAALIERAVRVGLLAIRDAGVTMNVDRIEKEFDRLVRRADEAHERAAAQVDKCLRETFADGDGRLPRTLDRFLGDKGTLRKFVDDLFDDQRRDSAIGRLRTVLGAYFDGDGAIVARMLDPRREDSPLHGFRGEIREALTDLGERLVRLEAGRDAAARERARGTAKGGDFEDAVEARLTELAHQLGDVVERTSAVVGNSVRGRSGDVLLTLNPSWCRGMSVRIAIEAKSGPVGLIPICRELDEARRNRGAAIAVAVFAPGCAPRGCAPLTLHGDHVICELDPDDPDDIAFEFAVRLARALAVAGSREQATTVNVGAVRRHLEALRAQLKCVQGMKGKLTSISTVAKDVSATLDVLRQGIAGGIEAIEDELAKTDVENESLPLANRTTSGHG